MKPVLKNKPVPVGDETGKSKQQSFSMALDVARKEKKGKKS